MKTISFFAAAKLAVLCAVAVGTSSVCRAKIPDGMQWGVTFGFYATNGYFGSVEAKAEIDAIARAETMGSGTPSKTRLN